MVYKILDSPLRSGEVPARRFNWRRIIMPVRPSVSERGPILPKLAKQSERPRVKRSEAVASYIDTFLARDRKPSVGAAKRSKAGVRGSKLSTGKAGRSAPDFDKRFQQRLTRAKRASAAASFPQESRAQR